MTPGTANEDRIGGSTTVPTVRSLPIQIWDTVATWRQRLYERAALQSLDDRLLRDVGLTRADVWHECRKKFWEE